MQNISIEKRDLESFFPNIEQQTFKNPK